MSRIHSALSSSPLLRRVFVGTPWRGIYPSFAAAQAEIPQGKSVGYNSEAAANLFKTYPVYRRRVTDYITNFHLRDLISPTSRVFDFGGSVGIAFYVYQQYLPFPEGARWIVCDVPAIVEVGRARASEHPTDGLSFTSEFTDGSGCDVLHTAGTLQFIEPPLATLLAGLSELPPYLLINRIPIWDRDPLWTLHTIGDFICPYQVFNRDQFIESILSLGYRLVDNWDCPESSLSIRFRPKMRLNGYQGYYFALPSYPVKSVRQPANATLPPNEGQE